MTMLRFLDVKEWGFVFCFDLIRFCDEFLLLTNKLDVVLELKYLAYFIEVKANSNHTLSYLERNTSLRRGFRIKEVEIVTEFNKHFRLPTQIISVLYNYFDKVKKGKELMLEDIAKVIDSFRTVPLTKEEQKPVTT